MSGWPQVASEITGTVATLSVSLRNPPELVRTPARDLGLPPRRPEISLIRASDIDRLDCRREMASSASTIQA